MFMDYKIQYCRALHTTQCPLQSLDNPYQNLSGISHRTRNYEAREIKTGTASSLVAQWVRDPAMSMQWLEGFGGC